ncbi:hypothetical protein [Dysgonomonas sp. GY617]|uniref:hypothetical protein n=1 Tax=Dysgonomonas sp. GY617 TaxID=2780420 RepID=UPI0018843316|nr:hypothetical protein [Dysgonomonas sp. GY617]MBF0576622.1 hypothetical protein [Dysgonomonas sp. GY617]
MTRDQQLKTLKSKKANKEQLREALAASLGVAYEPATKDQQENLFTECRSVFFKAYKDQTGLDYSFVGKDAKALTQILEKIGNMSSDWSDQDKRMTFEALVINLPDWYKKNAFSISVINNKFNEIVASIKQNGRQQQTGGDLKSKLAERFRARQS